VRISFGALVGVMTISALVGAVLLCLLLALVVCCMRRVYRKRLGMRPTDGVSAGRSANRIGRAQTDPLVPLAATAPRVRNGDNMDNLDSLGAS